MTVEFNRVSDPDWFLLTNGGPIRRFLELPAALVEEARFRVGTLPSPKYQNDGDVKGLHVKAVDPANVAMIDAVLPLNGGGFRDDDGFPEENQVVGVNIGRMADSLTFARRTVGDNGDPVQLRYGDVGGVPKLETYVHRANQDLEEFNNWALIDPDSIRLEPDIPDLNLPCKAVWKGQKKITAFHDVVKQLGDVSDHLHLQPDPNKDGAFMLVAEGDLNTDFFRFSNGYELVGDEDDAGASSMFTTGYWKDMAEALKLAKVDRLTFYWGEELPVVVQFLNEDTGATGVFMLAPRIQSD